MRLPFIPISVSLAALAVCGGCAPELLDPAGGGLFGLVAGVADIRPNESGAASPSVLPTEGGQDGTFLVQGAVEGDGDYRMFELGRGRAGQRWTVVDDSGLFGPRSFLVVLFDADYDLLYRRIVSPTQDLTHILRADTPSLYLGITPSFGSSGGNLRLIAGYESGITVPNPRRQTVWLNFDGGADVDVHARRGLSFPPFEADMLGAAYEGADEAVKAAIVAAMREDYADYNVVILTSDEGPPPDAAYATLHFGGYDGRLLGLADNVDQYNEDRRQHAIIYMESFADFEVMLLTPEEMGQMVGNVASHEFGHLLGLFHTQNPEDLMDTTGSAWDLAGDQVFLSAELEPSVFPFGYENADQRLAETVGRKSAAAKERYVTRPLGTEIIGSKARIRALVRTELRYRCGNCLNPDW